MEQRGGIYFLTAIMAVMLAMVVASLMEVSLEAKLLPIVIGGITSILAAIELSRALLQSRKRTKDATGGEEVGTSRATSSSRRPYVIAGGWPVAFVLAIYLLGFVVAVPLLIAAYMKSYRASWLPTITSAIVTTVCIYGLFDLLLQVTLYRGLLLEWLGG